MQPSLCDNPNNGCKGGQLLEAIILFLFRINKPDGVYESDVTDNYTNSPCLTWLVSYSTSWEKQFPLVISCWILVTFMLDFVSIF